MSSLERQVVLVTGCSTGIGRALATELRARGHRPFATARRLESISDLAQAGVDTLALDVNDPASIASAVKAVIERAGRLDVLINNAGVNTFGPLLEVPLDKARQVFETNVLGVVATTQAVFPHFAERRAGRIINVGSVVGVLPTPFAASYCASKSAVHMLSDVLRMEVKPFGIDVVVVQPGGVRSHIAATSASDVERYRGAPSHYGFAYEGIVKRANASQENPMPAEEFAAELVKLGFATPAPRVIRLGTGSEYLPKLAELPPDDRDAMLSANYGL
ncbi:MAG TPA: SDR family NAD(P)-dependent oxidoreductase [Polyangiaceae bacterium]|jgi:NAD(P)-dependent dehydrogenase (short-subunit alcohol dehydrogenase family)|nr:SDR family NAD(P)-dependent oxidoreductase [Polyangiaceae bacterium]